MVNAYIPDQRSSTVSVIDTGTNTVSTVTAGAGTYGAAVTPDGNTAYIANNSANTVSAIDTRTNSVVATISVGTGPGAVAVTPDGTKVYVSGNHLSVINTATNVVIATLAIAPAGIAITPDGKKAYVTNNSANTVSVIDVATNTIKTGTGYPISVGIIPIGIAVSPDGSKVYVTNQGTGSNGSLSVISTSSDTVSSSITSGLGVFPTGVAFTPDGTLAYVTDYAGTSVYVIDVATDTVKTGAGYPITVDHQPIGVAFTPDGKYAYVPNTGSGTVSVIDVTANTVSTTITIGASTSPSAAGIFIQPASIPMTTIYAAPQGRLTLTSNTPVMTADSTAQTSVYYSPYQGNIVPIYDGANMQSYTFGQLTMTLNTSNQLSGKIYDLFIFLNSSVVTIGAGPAWSSTTSRGTGAGTTQLQQIDGLWVNTNTITLKNGSTSYSSIPVGEATYVGSIYMTANGQTGMAFKPAAASGGTNNVLGVYNAYNRVTTISKSSDSTASWTYSTSTWRSANNSASNRVSFIDGLQQSSIRANYVIETNTSVNGIEGATGVNLDSTSASPVDPLGFTSSANLQMLSAYGRFLPQLGLHYVQAVEWASAATVTYTGNGVAFNGLMLEIEM